MGLLSKEEETRPWATEKNPGLTRRHTDWLAQNPHRALAADWGRGNGENISGSMTTGGKGGAPKKNAAVLFQFG